jgi:predicted acetyltransferase
MCDRCAEGIRFFGLGEPQAAMLESYVAALRTGWSPNNARDVSAEQIAEIERDGAAFLENLLNQTGSVTLPDGTVVPRLPFRLFWLWDGEFCGSISLRWQPGTTELPPYVSGHVGYAVVPWKRNHGYASRALSQILSEAREVGLEQISLTVAPGNAASRTVIIRNGGNRVGTWSHPAYRDHGDSDHYIIPL